VKSIDQTILSECEIRQEVNRPLWRVTCEFEDVDYVILLDKATGKLVSVKNTLPGPQVPLAPAHPSSSQEAEAIREVKREMQQLAEEINGGLPRVLPFVTLAQVIDRYYPDGKPASWPPGDRYHHDKVEFHYVMDDGGDHDPKMPEEYPVWVLTYYTLPLRGDYPPIRSFTPQNSRPAPPPTPPWLMIASGGAIDATDEYDAAARNAFNGAAYIGEGRFGEANFPPETAGAANGGAPSQK
jgi:hypothetical protein